VTPPLRWGVIGAGSWVANEAVLPAIAASPTATLVAVASRDRDAATEVGARFGAARAHGDYLAVLEDAEVEAVYIPLPNSLHRDWTVRCAAAGKHVLCEKPLAATAADARAMSDACTAAGVRLIEAYMTPFHPRSAAVAALLAGGALGALSAARAVFSFELRDRANIRWQAALGGGALLDVGVYCLAPLLALAGRAPLVAAAAVEMRGDVDETSSAELLLDDGVAAEVRCSFAEQERQSLWVLGSDAALEVDRAFTPGPQDTEIVLARPDGSGEVRRTAGGNPYLAMVENAAVVIRGEVEPIRGPAQAIAVLDLIERIRRTADLAHPR